MYNVNDVGWDVLRTKYTHQRGANIEILYIFTKHIQERNLKYSNAFGHIKLPKKQRWIKSIMKYIQKHMWADTEPTAGILNGRWNRHVWEDALSNVDEATKKGIDPKLFKKWLSITTNKLFETQLALSRHRIKLSKRLKDRIFERPKYIHPLLKKQLIENNAVLYIPEQNKRE